MNPYFQSFVWLIGCGGAGYALMELTKPSAAKLEEIRKTSNPLLQNERERKKALFMNKLEEATHSKPIYLKSRAELEADSRK